MKAPFLGAALFAALLAISAGAQSNPTDRARNLPREPFHIMGNLYYVGASDVTAFLITSPQGDIVLDGGFAETAPQILANIRKLGFDPKDVKWLLNSHAHSDHAGGLAELKRATGAQVAASAGDAQQLERGGLHDPDFADRLLFPAVRPDRILQDGDTVTVGDATMTAHITPGHTHGCTTWTMPVHDQGRTYQAVFVCSVSIVAARVTPLKEEYERSFRILRGLPANLFFGSHGIFFDLDGKARRLAAGETPNPFLDGKGYLEYLDQSEAAFRKKLKEEAAATGH